MMDTDTLLEILEERGLRVELKEDGSPTLKGPKEEITPVLLDVIKLPIHREEILRRLRAPAVRRIVLLKDGEQSEAERTLAEPVKGQELNELRPVADKWAGRWVAAEWWDAKRQCWVRFAWAQGGWEAKDSNTK